MITSTPGDTSGPRQLNGKSARIQSHLEFPRIVEIKIFLKATEGVETQLRTMLNEKCPQEDIISISCRSSKGGKYHSFTCRIWIVDETELEELYQYLSSQEQVLYLL